MRRPSRRIAGQTLIELLCVLAVVAVLAGLALPAAAELLRDMRQRERVTAFVVSAQLARSEALRRGHAVTLCPSADGESCGEDLARGWIVFADRGGDRDRDPDDALLDRYQAPDSGPVRTSVRRFTWRPAGRRATNGTVTFCAEAPSRRSRAVVVSYTGRPRVAERLPDGRRLPC